MNLYGSICLSDIPRELIKEHENGRRYLNIEIKELATPSKFGATHAIKASVKREDRKEGVNYFIGNLKPSQYGNQPKPEAPAPRPIQSDPDNW